MWAWVIPIIVDFLTKFITELLNQWLNPTTRVNMRAKFPVKISEAVKLDIGWYRSEFVRKFGWRFWLGPKRKEYAGKLFDKVAAKYNDTHIANQLYASVPAKEIARQICDVTLTSNEL